MEVEIALPAANMALVGKHPEIQLRLGGSPLSGAMLVEERVLGTLSILTRPNCGSCDTNSPW